MPGPSNPASPAWARFYANHPNVLASWGEQNGREPNCACCAPEAVATAAEYPEHERLRAVAAQTQAAGEFIEWLAERGIVLAGDVEVNHGTAPLWPDMRTEFRLLSRNVQDLLAEWKGIDRKLIEQEKRAMLEKIRAAQAAS